ncbi:MAG: 5-deoxy-glucuronate isomerase [Chloroflexi bacterium]|nr:5-deoxy-glucuronate isomerase [Chloroflexota bacterium]
MPAQATSLLRRATSPGRLDGATQVVTPGDAGWTSISFSAHHLAAGQHIERPGDGQEVGVVILEGSADVRAGTRSFGSVGSRTSVFDGPPPPVVLVAAGEPVAVRSATAATVLIASAPSGDSVATRLIEPGTMRVEERGSGQTARRVHHLLPPGEAASRLILVEVYTPGGNWSSYPPHKHDTEDQPRESLLEELYYYRFARPQGFAFARVYTADRSLDQALTPMDRDVVLVPRGYHPVGMPAGYDGYYLNVMAGPTRLWNFTLDPDHEWLMDWSPTAPR